MLRDPALVPLSHQHHHALALCVLIDRSTGDIETKARMIVDHFDSEMQSHFEVEESVLFPFAAKFPATCDLADELIAEHRRMTALVDLLRQTGDRAAIAEFTDLLRRHVRKEENFLFQEMQRTLSREDLDHIGRLMDRRERDGSLCPPRCRVR